MFKIDYNDSYLHLIANGKLTHNDYINHLIPSLDDAILKHGKLNLLLETNDFHGWEVKAIWDDLKTGIEHKKDFNKVAIVGEKLLEKVLFKFFSIFINAKTQYFNKENIEQAKDWVKGL